MKNITTKEVKRLFRDLEMFEFYRMLVDNAVVGMQRETESVGRFTIKQIKKYACQKTHSTRQSLLKSAEKNRPA
jgi:hypothetical protein